MAFFSRKKAEHVEINTATTESSNPVLSDVIDLRKMRAEMNGRSHKNSNRESVEIDEARVQKSKITHENQKKDSIKSFFSKKTSQPKIISYTPSFPTIEIKSKKFWYVFAFISIFIIGGFLLTTTFSWAVIIIQPKNEEIRILKKSITVDPSLSLSEIDSGRIPGEEVQYTEDISVSFNATGQKYAETRSRGIIIIKNEYSSASQTLVAQTRFQDEKTKKVFRITKAVTVPGAKIENSKVIPSSINAEVLADGVGEGYNLAEGSFVIPGFQGTPKFNGFTATIKEPFIGGFRGNSKVITRDDLQKANIDFVNQARRALEQKRTNDLPADFKVIPSAENFEIISKSEPRIGDAGEVFVIRGKARWANIAFQEKTLFEFFNEASNKELAGSKTSIPQKSNIIYDSATLTKNKKLNIVVSGSVATVSIINRAHILTVIANKSLEEAKTILRDIEGVDTFGIKLFPFWKSTLPRDFRKIEIRIVES
ncbi:MAG: hypothetical protein AAB362_03435 [Patescibacteria group bacterium]